MKQNTNKYVSRFSFTAIGGLVIGIILILTALMPLSFNQTVNNADIDLLFKMRGSRTLSEDFLFVFIGPEDIQELGGWPITRDYYGYLIHVLQQEGIRIIGIDILFDKANLVYPEFDGALADFISNARNVCLPMVYGTLTPITHNHDKSGTLFRGISPVYPIAQFQKSAAGCGFSNLGSDAVSRRIPLAVLEEDELKLSFGVTLAAIFLEMKEPPEVEDDALLLSGKEEKVRIPLTKDSEFIPDHSGGLETIQATGMIDLLRIYENYPDSLDLHDKLVIIGVTLPGISSSAATPLSDLMPASIIHATVAENIISGRFLKQTSLSINVSILVIFVLITMLLWRYTPIIWMIILAPSVLILYWLAALLLFSGPGIILPLLYPTVLFLLENGWFLSRYTRLQKQEMLNYKQLLQKNITEKEGELKTTQENLFRIRERLFESSEESEKLKKLADERKRTIVQLENELSDLKTYTGTEKLIPSQEFPEIIRSEGGRMDEVLDMVNRIREDDIPVLILGETGTGKEVIARTIHNISRRSDNPFIAVNCGALAENLLESELFGHEKGSFTGAYARRKGRFELADGGTVFLDEINETTPSFQARLLRVIQEGIFERVGGEFSLKVNVRIIAASNRDMQKELEAGRFRQDLYYRLNGIQIILPALRERKEDIPLLVPYFLKKYEYQLVNQISEQVMAVLKSYSWPGNVRELENCIRRAAILAQSEQRKMIRLDDLPNEIIQKQSSSATESQYVSLENQVLDMLRSQGFSHSSITTTANALGNRDRGTITEHLRGMCFESLAENNFDIERTAREIAASEDQPVIDRVKKKINVYLKNLHPLPGEEEIENFLKGQLVTLPQVKNLPGKYHQSLIKVIRHLKKQI
ncbi:MAG: CHASE2 domain-containing protein [Calditrichaeota bacterium]|nr:sigma 54-interacting transcriptional regulator [Calditrichota bacterium]RQW02893.1 MAG: CHASE2 domain-containing protein [Calditrichota bacterium]